MHGYCEKHVCKADNERLRSLLSAEQNAARENVERLRALWKDDETKGIAREAALEAQLTELREAAVAVCKAASVVELASKVRALAAVLAKVTP